MIIKQLNAKRIFKYKVNYSFIAVLNYFLESNQLKYITHIIKKNNHLFVVFVFENEIIAENSEKNEKTEIHAVPVITRDLVTETE